MMMQEIFAKCIINDVLVILLKNITFMTAILFLYTDSINLRFRKNAVS